jgi:metal iron transporter
MEPEQPQPSTDHTDEIAVQQTPSPVSSNNERRGQTIDRKFSLDEKPNIHFEVRQLPESQPQPRSRKIRDLFSKKTLLQCGAVLVKFGKFRGPGSIISVAYVDPDNFQTAISSGALLEFKLLFVILVANLIAIYLQVRTPPLGELSIGGVEAENMLTIC